MDDRKNVIKNNIEILSDYIDQHAQERNLINTLRSLRLMDRMVKDSAVKAVKYEHSLMVCRMMIDLNMDLSIYEDDLLLSAALCHILPEEKAIKDPYGIMLDEYRLDKNVAVIVKLLNETEGAENEELQARLNEIQRNKLALIIELTDRGNIVEQLYVMNSWQVRRFIYETRRYYFPMCIYAKENYHELLSPIGILLEKLRNLTDVSETLLYRFEEREIELSQEILALKEENATIKGIIKKLKNNKSL